MNSYQDIEIQPDAEMRKNLLLNNVFIKLHKAIFDLSATDIGISFPEVKKKLGSVIRIHSTKNRLEELQRKNWLGGLVGYCKVSEVLSVPEKIQGYKTVSRIQQKLSNSKLKRLVKRGSINESEVKNYKAKMMAGSLENPYLELQSASTNQKYRIYIQIGELKNAPVEGVFNHFGLSKQATVPWF